MCLGDGPADVDASNSPGAKHDTRPPGTFTREFMGLGEKPPSAPSPQSSEQPFPPGFGPTSPRAERANILSDIDIPAAKPEYSPLERNPYRGKKSEAEAGSPLGSQMGLQEESRNQNQKKKSGEFTNFFGGPGTQLPSESTDRLPLPDNSRLPEPDRRFRGEPSRSGKDIFDDEFFASSPKPASSTFTENLKAPEPLAAPKADRSARSPVPKFDSQVDFGGGGKSQNYTAPEPVPFGVNRSPKLDPASGSIAEPVWDRPAEPAGATKVFASPREAPMPGSAPVDDGPSEFTIIRSGNQLAPPPPPPPKQASGSGAGQFKLPSMQAPQMPPAPQLPHAPPMPQAPPMPHAPDAARIPACGSADGCAKVTCARASGKEPRVLPATDHCVECGTGTGHRAGTLFRPETSLRRRPRRDGPPPAVQVEQSSTGCLSGKNCGALLRRTADGGCPHAVLP